MSEETKTITITPDKDVIIKHRNSFQKTLLDNILDLKRHEAIKKIKPDYQRKNQAGKYEDVDELITAYQLGAANAKSYVDICDELLAMEAEGKLSEAWSEITEGPKEEAAEETKDEAPAEEEKPAEEDKPEEAKPEETKEDEAPVEVKE